MGKDVKIPATMSEVRLVKNVKRDVTPGHFKIVESSVPEIGPGEVLVRVDYVALTAAMKELMRGEGNQLPLPPFEVGGPVGMGGVGTVVRSNSQALAVGDTVQSMQGWSEFWTGPAESFYQIDATVVPAPYYYLNQGVTAYYGMADVAHAGKDDVVFVSGAAGGVGSLAGQIAKARGAARVIGSAGSKKKVDYLVKELGFDAAFDYHDGPVVDRLRELAPDGINVFFDNVGGEQFEAAVQAAAPYARFALCGALSGQIGASGGSPRLDLMTAITKHLEIRPFACLHTPEQIGAWAKHFGMWMSEGKLVFPHTVVDGGVSKAPERLLEMYDGKYTGNVILKVHG